MVSFTSIDFLIIASFFSIVLLLGFLPGKKETDSAEGFLLSNRKVGLFLFILTHVATWYGGILGVGEFTYRYGILSWFTQGLPYYIFAIIFAIFFAQKIRNASLFTIPDKLEEKYGRRIGLISAGLIFILVSPAPYLLMLGSLISLIFDISLIWGLIIGLFFSVIYLFKGGYKSDLMTDAFEFFVMFIGFIVILVFSYLDLGGKEYLAENLPAEHLSLTGGASPTFIIVWFLIALWTFTDPGFHQRCYAAKSGKIAKWGIIISIVFWALFDFLTTSTGLYAKAAIPYMNNPVLTFPILAEKILAPGFKGLFYAGLFATILSTLNSFLFISATTFGRDFVFKLKRKSQPNEIKRFTQIGLLISSIISFILAYYFKSVIDLWYVIGSICIPGIILLVLGAYYEKFMVSKNIAFVELLAALISSVFWMIIRPQFLNAPVLSEIEPMIVGLAAAVIIHIIGLMMDNKKGKAKI